MSSQMDSSVGLTSREIYEKKKKLIAEKINEYRARPDIMNEELLEVKQNLYQRVAIRALFNKPYNIWVWSRGLGKSWTAGLAAVDFALLYPGIRIGIAAPSFRQSKMIIENKIVGDLMERSPFVRQEIRKINNKVDTLEVEFYNGSTIISFPVGTDGSKIRGLRLQFIIIDEYAQMNKTIVDRVIKPMLAVRSGYEVNKTDYSDDVQNRMLFTSSAYFKFNHLFQTVKDYGDLISKGSDDHFVYLLDYKVGIDVGLYSSDFIENERKTQTTIDFDMEYGAKFIDLSESNWISPTELSACATESKIELNGEENVKYVAGLDVARVSGNDNTCMKVVKLIPNEDHYIRKEVYSKALNGNTFGKQNYEIRKILDKFPIERLYMDTTGLGVGLADELAKPYMNPDTGEVDPPLYDINNKEHTTNEDGSFLIYGQKFSLNFNYRLAVSMKKSVQKRKLKMYADETEGVYDDNLNIDELEQIDESRKTRNEIMSIEAIPKGNLLSFDVPKGGLSEGRKDRWTALSLCMFGADEMEEEFFNEDEFELPFVSISSRGVYN